MLIFVSYTLQYLTIADEKRFPVDSIRYVPIIKKKKINTK